MASEIRNGADHVTPPSVEARYQTFHAPVLLSMYLSRKSPAAVPAIDGKLPLAVAVPTSVRAPCRPLSVERLVNSRLAFEKPSRR